ncbi:response regulator transcription factor [Hydrogenophaga sp. 5NK40-0174]|uniref:response regulator transcription factor n=1 Tax=Hydrogenophaga sp. 5NK40-0174 TaxID=3127649 RepID=UPI003106556A
MRVLIVEDDAAIAQGLSDNLRNAGYAVDACSTVKDAWLSLQAEPFDAVLLDLGLPDGEGLDLLQRLRSQAGSKSGVQEALPHPDLPVLIMTARDGVTDRIIGLDTGADDYVIKPFNADELQARMRAMLRRSAGRSRPVIQRGDLVVDPASHVVEKGGVVVPLGAKEFAVLLAMLQASPRVMSRSRLESALYGFGESVESNAIEVHVHHLRKKLGDQLIKTVRGVGYFIPDEG